jgi:organic hydroperoxide reductase OsmC/OhrA
LSPQPEGDWPAPLPARWRRQIEIDPEQYDVEALGEIETDDGMLVIKRISVRYRLAAPAERREEVERVHGFHARFCPVARSLQGAIEVSTELELL